MGQVTRMEITLSRSKIIRSLIISVIFVLLGLWIILFKPESQSVFNTPIIKYGAALSCIFFFGWAALALSKKLQQKEAGIVIDEQGITDRSSAAAAGMIHWKDIIGFSTASVMKQSFILVQLQNPEEYINRATGTVRRRSMQYNLKTYGTPVAISANALSCSLAELESVLQKALSEYRS